MIRVIIVLTAMVLCLRASEPATAAMYEIENPAAKIANPVDTMYDPAGQTNNPAADIHNPEARSDGRNPLSAPSKPLVSTATAAEETTARSTQPPHTSRIPQTKYHYKTVAMYIRAAKKSFVDDDYLVFVSLTEDALRRINAGTLKASANTKHKLLRYQVFGYGLLD